MLQCNCQFRYAFIQSSCEFTDEEIFNIYDVGNQGGSLAHTKIPASSPVAFINFKKLIN